MKKTSNEERIEEALTRGVSAIYPSKETLQEILLSGERLRVYLGVDPTGPHLHLGHLTNLLLLKRLQKLGHKIIFLIGDFTARIGDPTDKMAPRQALTEGEVKENMKTFKEQAERVISFSGENPAEIRHNSEWYKKMTLDEFMGYLVGYFTVRNMLQRDMFKKRKGGHSEEEWLNDIGLKELIYPLLQGHDSVELDADVEVGGNDQIFNMSIGRALRKARSKDGKTREGEKFFIATKLLENPNNGKKLMNKSEGGLINLDDSPRDIFGKVMALDDASMFPVAEFCTEMPTERIHALQTGVTSGKINPRDAKIEIAGWVVQTLYGEGEVKKAAENFRKTFREKAAPFDAPLVRIPKKATALELAMATGAIKSKSEARRLIAQGGFDVNGTARMHPDEVLQLKNGDSVKVGKRKFFKVKIR